MAASPKPVPASPVVTLELGDRSAFEKISEKKTDELVIALCGPIGTPLHEVADMLEKILRDTFQYEVFPVRMSEFILRSHEKQSGLKLSSSSRYERVTALIEEGNRLRGIHGASILAEQAVKEIAISRAKRKKTASVSYNTPARVCHIVDSIKNQKELDLLRSVYGSLLYCIGVFSPPQERWKRLEYDGMSLDQIGRLIDRDSGEEIPSGQTVEETFPQSDYFLRFDERGRTMASQRLERFFDILLGRTVRTPTSNETAMYMAATAACNSACLSRQVGAAIVNPDGELVAIGWNDVPKFGGNLYSADCVDDHRCFLWEGQKCHNDAEKSRIINEIVDTLYSKGVIGEEKKSEARAAIKGSPIKHLLEFSRAVHAEMHSIIMAGHLGKGSLRKHKLFCTTYPCHSCARHIVAAGISEVCFIEPYTKSLATRLHSDAITESEDGSNKLKLIPFDGIAPNRYRALFEMNQPRKDSGKAISVAARTARVKLDSYIESFPALEALVVERLKDKEIEI